MKKLLALLLAVVMVFALAACGGGNGNAAAPEAPAAPAAEPDPAAPEAPAEAPAETVAVDPLDISFSTTYQETETGGEIIHKWIDLLAEYSDGAITVTPYWGGTLFGDPDILDGLSSGAINMTTFGHMPHLDTLNYLSIPNWVTGGTEACLKVYEEVLFNNPETSALVRDELAEHNIIFLNVLPGGANAFCTTYPFTDLDSLIAGSKSFGNFSADIFEPLGFQVTALPPPDIYDALQRGLIDGTQMGLTPMVSMQWYDVAPYWALDGTYGAGNFISANLDWWNGLTADQQAVIQKAAEDVAAWSMALYDAETENYIATIEAATGNEFVTFSDEDLTRIWEAFFNASVASAFNRAELNGKVEGMITIYDLVAEMTGVDWHYEG